MRKIKYYFDSRSLTYEKFNPDTKSRLLTIFLFFASSLVAAILILVVYSHFFTTPKSDALERQKQEILSMYSILEKQVDNATEKLGNIEHRDDYVYRSIFDINPIPPSVRDAGYGGVNRYEELMGYASSDVMINTSNRIDKLSKKLYIQSKSFDIVVNLALEKEKMIESIPAIQPIAIKDFSRISDYFGVRNDPFTGKPTMHNGMDFTGPVGSEIYATGEGVIIEAGYNLYGYGNRVIIDHGFDYETIYAHLDRILVYPGQKVVRGQIIGTLGNTGRSTGPHLHYEVRHNNKPQNPINYYFDDITAEEFDLMIEVSSRIRNPMD